MELSPELEIDLEKLSAEVDLKIENGELNNVESMKSLSRFIDLKELENIRFETLKNKLEIKNKKISMPKMEILSSALNLTAYGTHTFNNDDATTQEYLASIKELPQQQQQQHQQQ